jgi:hypothetical protein
MTEREEKASVSLASNESFTDGCATIGTGSPSAATSSVRLAHSPVGTAARVDADADE